MTGVRIGPSRPSQVNKPGPHKGYKDKARRKAYMKEYMVQYRAKKKERSNVRSEG